MRKYLLILIFLSSSLLHADCVPSLISAGGGYFDAGSRHSGGLFQIEYKWNRRFWNYLRPEAALIIPEFRSVFLGVGMGIEFYVTNRIIFCPNFMPGLYYRGKGKNLGHPIEFRSALEVAYELQEKGGRMGLQFYHISNAHLSDRNPGANAITFYLAFPL